jgi:hypothetical protein
MTPKDIFLGLAMLFFIGGDTISTAVCYWTFGSFAGESSMPLQWAYALGGIECALATKIFISSSLLLIAYMLARRHPAATGILAGAAAAGLSCTLTNVYAAVTLQDFTLAGLAAPQIAAAALILPTATWAAAAWMAQARSQPQQAH